MKTLDALDETIKSIEVRRGAIQAELKTLDEQLKTLKKIAKLVRKGDDEYQP